MKTGPFRGMCTKEGRHTLFTPIVTKKRKRDEPFPEDQVLPSFKKRQLASRKPQNSEIASEECALHTSFSRQDRDFPDDDSNHGNPTKQHRKVRFRVFSTSPKTSPRRMVSQAQGSKVEPWLSVQNRPGFMEGKENASWPISRPSPVNLEKVSVRGTCQSLTPGRTSRIIRGREGIPAGHLASASAATNSVSVSSSPPVSTLPSLSDCDDVADPELSTDGKVYSHWDSEEMYQEDSEITEANWAELSSEEEVELQLEFDSETESPGNPNESVIDARDGDRTKHQNTSPVLQRHELVQYLFPVERTNNRVPIKYLLKADTGHLRAGLVQSRMTYQGKEIVFSRAIQI